MTPKKGIALLESFTRDDIGAALDALPRLPDTWEGS